MIEALFTSSSWGAMMAGGPVFAVLAALALLAAVFAVRHWKRASWSDTRGQTEPIMLLIYVVILIVVIVVLFKVVDRI